MIKWIEGNINQLIVTLSSHNITLNQNASNFFIDSKYVSVGIDYDNFELAIHPVTKSEIERNTFSSSQLHKISHGRTYARISHKALCDHIAKVVGEPLDGQKYFATFDEKNKLLLINLQHPLMKGSG